MENSAGSNAVSSARVDGGGDDDPAAWFGESTNPMASVFCKDCRNVSSEFGVSVLDVETADGVAAAPGPASVVEAWVVADETGETVSSTTCTR